MDTHARHVKARLTTGGPTCRQELGDIRCLALEKVAESLELPCKYGSVGCPEIFPYYSKLKHEFSIVLVSASVSILKPFSLEQLLHMAFLRFMGDEMEARNYSYSLEVGGNGRKLTWEGERKELKLRVTGRIWKEQQNPDGGACMPNLCT
ncbi:hypothetical protein HAX54_002058 [Datura stramonium]|uniref:Seven-in-absentia protein TRAF-like domain-containing protein n=1 Tax=Datura stramonium TaxID=4076 RepID=A0ABS8T419_DATST|nr:hypothetical protein [Datura stramonium]